LTIDEEKKNKLKQMIEREIYLQLEEIDNIIHNKKRMEVESKETNIESSDRKVAVNSVVPKDELNDVDMDAVMSVVHKKREISDKAEQSYLKVDLNLKQTDLFLKKLQVRLENEDPKILAEVGVAKEKIGSFILEIEKFWLELDKKMKNLEYTFSLKLIKLKAEFSSGAKDENVLNVELSSNADDFEKEAIALARSFTDELNKISNEIEILSRHVEENIRKVIKDKELEELRAEIKGSLL
jgi:hypothetical protein